MPEADARMTCDEALAVLEPYVDARLAAMAGGEDGAALDGAARSRFEAHLESCPACAEELALAWEIARELRALPHLDCPPQVMARVRQTIGSRPVEARRGGALRRWMATLSSPALLRPVLAAAALVAFAGAALLIHDLDRPPRQPPPPAVSAEALARATAEARLAFAYVGRAGRRAASDLRDDVLERHLVTPVARTLRGAFPAPVGEGGPDDRKGT
jgi:anti-sigma factor RsiW